MIYTESFIIYIYINVLPKVSNKLFPLLFADDTTMRIKGSNIKSIIVTFNNELNNLNDRLGTNK